MKTVLGYLLALTIIVLLVWILLTLYFIIRDLAMVNAFLVAIFVEGSQYA